MKPINTKHTFRAIVNKGNHDETRRLRACIVNKTQSDWCSLATIISESSSVHLPLQLLRPPLRWFVLDGVTAFHITVPLVQMNDCPRRRSEWPVAILQVSADTALRVHVRRKVHVDAWSTVSVSPSELAEHMLNKHGCLVTKIINN